MAKIAVDDTACILCGACVQVCMTAKVFDLGPSASIAARPEACWGCGQCVSVCPVDAIDHDDFPLEKCSLIDERSLPSTDDLTALFRSRRSNRTFSDKTIPRDLVRELVNIGRWAPSASNNQALDWIAIDDRSRIAELSRMTIALLRQFTRLARHPLARIGLAVALGPRNARQAAQGFEAAESLSERARQGIDPIFYDAPLLLIGHHREGHPLGRDDAIYAAYNIMLAAQRYGLATCQIGLFQLPLERSRKLRRAAAIPDGRVPQVCLVVGYPRYHFRRMVVRRPPDLVWNPR